MKPLRIQITNLGAIPSADIDLTGVTCCSIAGPNGAGKSTAFTVAPMWSLFGTTKSGTGIDDMVRAGTSETAVTFDFDHQGSVWRIIRTRSTKGKGKSTLELQRQSGELWASESGASIAETQKKIINLLGLDEETFSTSSMILQGQSNAFTARPAGQRKAILAQILQLDQYEDLQDKARAKVAATNISLERDKAMLATLETRLAEQPQLQLDLDGSRRQLADLESDETALELTLTSERATLATLIKREEDAARYKKQAEEYRDEANGKNLLRIEQVGKKAIADSYLEQEPDILAKAAEHDRIREQAAVLQVKDKQRESLARDGEQITRELDQIEASLKKVCVDIGAAENLLAEMPTIEAAVANLDAAKDWLAAHELAKSRHDEETRKLAEIKNRIASKDAMMDVESASKLSEIDTCKKRAAMLQDAQCIDIDRAECKFLADAKDAYARVASLQFAYMKWQAEALDVLAEEVSLKAGIELSIEAIDYDPAAHALAKKQVGELSAMELRLKSIGGTGQLLATMNAQRTDLETRQADLNERRQQLREDYKKLRSELAELPELMERLTTLEKYVKQREMLPAIKEKKLAAAEQAKLLGAEIDALTEKAKQAHILYVDTVPNGDQVQNATDEINNYQTQLDAVRKSKTTVTLQIGALTAKLEALAKDSTEREAITKRMAPLAKELTRWQILVKAFGRDGIPALIIENTVPELERIANEILGQMSGGKHNLRFETQRELKSKAGMAETLDIIVGDWAGERIYETFSGGEQLRIDFAIRFALAELLARRAGSRIDFLCVDEGFGSQSDEYLPLVIEAVKSVASRFGMVLVISHVKQVQEAFEQTIVFRPDGESVEVKVA